MPRYIIVSTPSGSPRVWAVGPLPEGDEEEFLAYLHAKMERVWAEPPRRSELGVFASEGFGEREAAELERRALPWEEALIQMAEPADLPPEERAELEELEGPEELPPAPDYPPDA